MNREIRNVQGELLDYIFHDGGSSSNSVTVIGHGVTGNMDRPLVVALAEGLASAGFSALRFSFAGNGDSEGDFRDSTVTKEVADLGSVLDALEGENYSDLYYAGHSMGAAVGVIRANSDPRIKALISLGGMVATRKFAEDEFDDGGDTMWGDRECPLSSAFMDDMRRIDSVAALGAGVKVPWLLIHGTEDDVVPIHDTEEVFKIANEPKEKVIIDGCDHVFSGEKHCGQMVDAVVSWVSQLKVTTSVL